MKQRPCSATHLGLIVPDPRHSMDEERFVLVACRRRTTCWQYCSRTAGKPFPSSARERLPAASGEAMKKTSSKRQRSRRPGADDIRPKYDFSRAVRNQYAARYAAGSAVVVLEPDVAAAFPNSREANDALRALAGIIRKHGVGRPPSRTK